MIISMECSERTEGMFREIVRKKQALSREECVRILETEPRGVLSVIGDDGYPYGMPMNHYYDPEDGHIYFHSGMKGHRTDALEKCDKVSFCVYDDGFRREGEWALNIKSVIVFGRIRVMDDRERAVNMVRKLCAKFTADTEYVEKEIAQAVGHTLFLELIPEHMTGKLVNEA